MNATEAAQAISERFKDAVSVAPEFRGESTVVAELDSLHPVMKFCREELDFNYLIDICSVDNMGEDPRFEVIYELYSLTTHVHLRIKSMVAEDVREVVTVSDIWPTADWHEREVYDMMGIEFKGHGDLRRILMWEGYPFFPLRKDFPLAGKPSEMPDVAFTSKAPLEGGPFVTSAGAPDTAAREPRARD
ncbi:MAG: NADH-quinone oxidoreductase subunit C [Verrucomicrobiota bacterium]